MSQNEISIPINITEVKNEPLGNQIPQNINSVHGNQLARKPKNQFVTGTVFPGGSGVLGGSPFVFLRQQLAEVKQNLPIRLVGDQRGLPRPPQSLGFTPFVFGDPSTGTGLSPVPSIPNTGSNNQQFFSLGASPAPASVPGRLPAGTFVFRDPALPLLSPVSPTPVPLSPVATPTPVPANDPIVFNEPTIKPLPGVLLEESRNNGLDQHIALIIEETSTEDTSQGANVGVHQSLTLNKPEDNDLEDDRGTENETETNKLPPFDPRKRRTTKRPSPASTSIRNSFDSDKIKTAGKSKGRKPILTGNQELDSTTEDLQERLRKLKESIRKTKESLTSQRQNLFVFAPAPPSTVTPAVKTVRKRVKARKRIPARLRQQQRQRLKPDQEDEINIPITIEEKPRSSGRGRGRGRGRQRNRVEGVEKVKETTTTTTTTTSVSTQAEVEEESDKPDKNELLERQLEETYGKDVVQGLLNVLVKAVSHPDKDRILHQLKGQLAAMNVDDVKKLQFGVDSHHQSAAIATTTTTTEKPGVELFTTTVTSTTTTSPQSDDGNHDNEVGSALEQQLRRVAHLADKFKNNKPILINTEKQFIKSKIPKMIGPTLNQAAEQFPVDIPMMKKDKSVTNQRITIQPFAPTMTPTMKKERNTERSSGSGLSTTLRNLFQQTERVQKIKMSLTTPVTAPDDMFETVLDGVPNGEPGLTPNFYERVPYIPDSVVTLLDTATDATTDPVVVTDTVINQVDDDMKEKMDIINDIMELQEMVKSNDAKIVQEDQEMRELEVIELPNVNTHDISIKLVGEDIANSKEIEAKIKKAMETPDMMTVLKESSKTENEIQNLHEDMVVHNTIPMAQKTESEIKLSHQMGPINKLISESRVPVLEKLVIEEKKSDSDMKLHIFNSSDLVLNNFMVHELSKTEKSDAVKLERSTTTTTPATTTTETKPESPVKHGDEDFKNRRRKLFRSSHEKDGNKGFLGKLNKADRLKLRKLFRKKLSHSNSNTSKQITIEEKQNPKKIIFRKNLIRGERRRVPPSSINNDPLVKSLQRQIKTQKSKLFSRKRPFTKIETTTPKIEQTEKVSSKVQ